jgi:hypothetical protein
MPTRKNKRGAGDEKSPAKPIKAAVNANKRQLIGLMTRILNDFKTERELISQMPSEPIQYYTMRRKLLTGEAVPYRDFFEMRASAARRFTDDIMSAWLIEDSRGNVALSGRLYSAEVQPAPYRDTYQIRIMHIPSYISYQEIVSTAEYQFEQRRRGLQFSIEEFLDIKFCEIVWKMQQDERRPNVRDDRFMQERGYRRSAAQDILNSMGDAGPFRDRQENENMREALRRIASLETDRDKVVLATYDPREPKPTEDKPTKEPPSPFSIIDLD